MLHFELEMKEILNLNKQCALVWSWRSLQYKDLLHLTLTLDQIEKVSIYFPASYSYPSNQL